MILEKNGEYVGFYLDFSTYLYRTAIPRKMLIRPKPTRLRMRSVSRQPFFLAILILFRICRL